MPLGIDPKVDFAFKLMLALGVLEMISKNPEDLQFYEARLKFLRDEQARLQAAMQEGLEKGLEKGMERGSKKAWNEGSKKG